MIRRAHLVLAATVFAALVLAAPASARPALFRQAADIPTLTPHTNAQGDPAPGAAKNVGGEAAAIFDANRDGVPDVVIVNGTGYYFVALGHRHRNGSVSYSSTAHLIGVPGDRRKEPAKGLGLTDYDGDGRLDLYLGNDGDGTLKLRNPRDLAHADAPANLDRRKLRLDRRFRSYVNVGHGRFAHRDLGAEAHGDTRSALFADFDDDGRQDEFASNAPYFGIWWGGDPSPSQLLPGRRGGTFGADVLDHAVVDGRGRPERHLLEDPFGRGNVDFKGIVTRDFDGDGRPDVIASAYSDVWDNHQTPPLAPADPAGAAIDLDHDGTPDGGYQGAWRHGILVLRNGSKPRHFRFQDQSRRAIPGQALGFGNRMDAYETIPLDFNHDGKLDLVVSGVRNYTAFGSLEHHTPLLQLYRNDSTPGHIRFTNVTKGSGLDAVNHARGLARITGGTYPLDLPGLMQGGGPLKLVPNLSAGAVVDINNDGRPDIVLVDRQFVSRNPLTGREFALLTFLGERGGRFRFVPSRRTRLVHTARDITYGDLNGDGRTDLVTVNGSGGGQTVNDDNYVFLNQDRTRNHWMDLRIRMRSGPDPLGLGARVTVYRAGTRRLLGTDEMRTDFAYRSKRDAVLHFGLAGTRCVDVRVRGLGRSRTVRGLRADRVQTVRLGRGRAARPQQRCR